MLTPQQQQSAQVQKEIASIKETLAAQAKAYVLLIIDDIMQTPSEM